jgi:hypothetical protein
MGINNSNSKKSPADPIIHRKLRRHKGDRRARMKSISCFCSVSAGTTLLLLNLLLQTMGGAEAAYLNGANPNSKLPTPSAPPTNQRYTFLKSPRDRHFTSTGILPPLSPSSDPEKEEQNLMLPLPPKTHPTEPIRVTYTNDPKTVEEWLCRNVPYDGCFLGFDIERLPECRSENPNAKDRSSFGHAAVVQLGTPSSCLVVHLVKSSGGATLDHHHPKHSNACAKILRSVLEDPSVIKAGCSIDEDLVLLHELWGNNAKNLKKKADKSQQTNRAKSKKRKGAVKTSSHHYHHHSNANGPSLQAKSRFDLGCVVLPKCSSGAEGATDALHGATFQSIEDSERPRGGDTSKNDPSHYPNHQYRMIAKRTTTINNKSGLQGLCKSILGVDLPKEKENSASDWTRFPLTDDQITYAARDAWAGAAIATKLASLNVDGWSQDKSPAPSSGGASNAQKKCNSSNVFSRSNLLKVLKRAETPMSQLAQRHRQRKEAKTELRTLLDKYFLNQQNHHHQELHPQQIALVQGNSTYIEALFGSCPLSSRRTLVNYAQKQRQLMEKSLPNKIRKRSIVLRQTVNAKVIDHKVVFEIDLIHPNENENNDLATPSTGNRQRPPPQDDYRARKRRNHGAQNPKD